MSNAPMGAGGTPAWEGRPHGRDARIGGTPALEGLSPGRETE